jgi:low affinity Fe/Cu permease
VREATSTNGKSGHRSARHAITFAVDTFVTTSIVSRLLAMADNSDEPATRAKPSIARRTSQLPVASKVLYRIDYYASMPAIAGTVVALLLATLIVGIILKFPHAWINSFEIASSSITLLMVFTIQHTQGREQAATQRKLDELLRAIPGAAESLMMLEEAPKDVMRDVEESQREVRADLVDDAEDEWNHDHKTD